MKTAMQILITELSFIEGLKNDEIDISQKSILTTATIKNALEKEKEQIIDAYEDGKQNGIDSIININSYIIGEFYYNQTYNQNK
jgi:hypothetical protein